MHHQVRRTLHGLTVLLGLGVALRVGRSILFSLRSADGSMDFSQMAAIASVTALIGAALNFGELALLVVLARGFKGTPLHELARSVWMITLVGLVVTYASYALRVWAPESDLWLFESVAQLAVEIAVLSALGSLAVRACGAHPRPMGWGLPGALILFTFLWTTVSVAQTYLMRSRLDAGVYEAGNLFAWTVLHWVALGTHTVLKATFLLVFASRAVPSPTVDARAFD
jgi:hypothetical protein